MYNKEILRENFTYANGGFYKKGSDPNSRTSWLFARYSPVSEPTIIINDTPTYLKNAVYVYHVDIFDPKEYTVVQKDNNAFNTQIENLKLVKRTKKRVESGNEYVTGAYIAYFGLPPEGFTVVALDGNNSNLSKSNLGLIPLRRS